MKYGIFLSVLLIVLMIGCQRQQNTVALEKEATSALQDDQQKIADNNVIIFTEPVIEMETRRILNKPHGDITMQDVLLITVFRDDGSDEAFGAVRDNITTLADLKWFKNLQSLELSGCNIYSLEGIENLTKLEVLNISRTDYLQTDISVLENLTGLKWLYARGCGISDISVLCNMPELEYLQLSNNNISDINSLKNLEKLTYLDLGENEITDISAIENLNQLEYINLQDNPIPEEALQKFYEPKETDYVTTKINAKINTNMPEFTFELLSCFNRLFECYEIQTLTITDSSSGKAIQTISIPQLSLFGNTSISRSEFDDMQIGFEDLNFDGYKDIRLFDTLNGNYRKEWIYLVWEPQTGLFQNDKRLNQISLPVFDQQEQLIYGMERGSAIDHWYYIYKYIGGEPIMIESLSQEGIRNQEKIQTYLENADISIEETKFIGFHETVLKLNEKTGEMEMARDEYVFYNDSDSISNNEIIAAFETTSEIGKMIYADNEREN